MIRSIGASTFSVATWLCAAAFIATLRLAVAQEPPKNFVFVDKPTAVAEITFDDAEGQARNLADFKGKVLLVNIWATWCGPCRTEMPALDRLQARLGGWDFEVIPVSIDRGGIEAIRKFYSEIGVRNLAMYVDPSGQVLRQTRALGLPTTLLIDAVDRRSAAPSDRLSGMRRKSPNFSHHSSRTGICRRIEPIGRSHRPRIVRMRQA